MQTNPRRNGFAKLGWVLIHRLNSRESSYDRVAALCCQSGRKNRDNPRIRATPGRPVVSKGVYGGIALLNSAGGAAGTPREQQDENSPARDPLEGSLCAQVRHRYCGTQAPSSIAVSATMS